MQFWVISVKFSIRCHSPICKRWRRWWWKYNHIKRLQEFI